MSYRATVVPIMIASPGDVEAERALVREAIYDWNYAHSVAKNTVLMPLGWETHSSPELGGRPQELINEQVLHQCDLLVGIFWTRLGTPTGKSESGTVEEVQRHLAAGKPAMVYFSNQPAVPDTIDLEQLAAVKRFREWCQTQGLTETFENKPDLRHKFARQLALKINQNKYLGGLIKEAGTEPSQVFYRATVVREEPGSHLSDEAKQLLVAAASDNGQLVSVPLVSGHHFQAGREVFGKGVDRRGTALWERGLEQLLDENLIVARGHKGQIFEVTALGYELADKLPD